LESKLAPYAPPENVLRVFERIRKAGLPPKINSDYLRQLGVTEAIIPRASRALEFLGLTRDGIPSDIAERIAVVPEAEWPAEFQGVLRTAYDEVFRVIDPETATRKAVDDAFRPMKPSGQRNRMVTLFLGLCQAAGFAVKEPPYQRPGQGQPKREKVVKAKLVKQKQDVPYSGQSFSIIERPALQPHGRLHPALVGIVATIPDIETRADLELWVTSFKATMELVKRFDS
jgi:hypothetical protein